MRSFYFVYFYCALQKVSLYIYIYIDVVIEEKFCSDEGVNKILFLSVIIKINLQVLPTSYLTI